MSIISRTKKDETAEVHEPSVPKPAKSSKGAPAILSASPRANLLPPEIGQNQRKRSVRAGLRIVVILVVFAVILASGGAFALSIAATSALEASRAEAQSLAQERLEFVEVQRVQSGIREGDAAVRVAGSTDLDWQSYLTQLQATLPANVALTDISVDTADPVTPYAQSEVPLEGERIATLSFTATTNELPSIPGWIDALSTLPGFADATPGSLEFEEGVYTASVVMHIDTEAYSGRFAPVEEEEKE